MSRAVGRWATRKPTGPFCFMTQMWFGSFHLVGKTDTAWGAGWGGGHIKDWIILCAENVLLVPTWAMSYCLWWLLCHNWGLCIGAEAAFYLSFERGYVISHDVRQHFNALRVIWIKHFFLSFFEENHNNSNDYTVRDIWSLQISPPKYWAWIFLSLPVNIYFCSGHWAQSLQLNRCWTNSSCNLIYT